MFSKTHKNSYIKYGTRDIKVLWSFSKNHILFDIIISLILCLWTLAEHTKKILFRLTFLF